MVVNISMGSESKIKLCFDIIKNEDLEPKLGKYDMIRLRSTICFRDKYNSKWTEAFDAIVDTGAHTTLIPLNIWNEIEFEHLIPYKIQGLSGKPECLIPVMVSKLKCMIMDIYDNYTPELTITAFLAETDEVPLILGFKDLLSNFPVYFNFETQEAYIEVK